jgi:DNA-directed RNA polymerase specialized sigma24 family protein
MSTGKSNERDARLVKRCVAGKAKAWRTLFDRYHPDLVKVTRLRLGKAGHDPSVAEDIVGALLADLVSNPARLARYDASKAPLGSFLRAMGRARVADYWKKQQRSREVPLPGDQGDARETIPSVTSLIEEVYSKLTPGEKKFIERWDVVAREAVGKKAMTNAERRMACQIFRKIRDVVGS